MLNEALVMGKLAHPNIPPIYQIRNGEQDLPEVIMQKIDGITFDDWLKESVSLPKETRLRESLQILIQVCYALEFAHSKNHIHRDIKPENIMVEAFNEVYLMDWGALY